DHTARRGTWSSGAPPCVPPSDAGASQASTPGTRAQSSRTASIERIMNAVDRPSASVAGLDSRNEESGQLTAVLAGRAAAGAGADAVPPLARPGCAAGEPPREKPHEDGVVSRPGSAEGERPSRLAGRRVQGHDRAPAAVDESTLDPPLQEEIGHAVHRVPLA